MSYFGWGFVVVLGVAIGTVLYNYLNTDQHRHDYQHGGSSSYRGRGYRGNVSDDNCTICLDSLSNRRRLRILSCGHTFHEHCITMWVNLRKICPICRNTI